MRKLRQTILLSVCAAFLGGCGLDVGQIFVQIKKAGGWQGVAQKAYESRAASAAMPSAQQAPVIKLQDNQKTTVDLIRSVYGDDAAQQVQGEFTAQNAELAALAMKAKDDNDFAVRAQAVMQKHSDNIKAISLKYSSKYRGELK